MSRRLTPTLLARPAAHAARVIASEQLEHVAVQLDAFLAGESLGFHDLRVALRRLRTWVRAFQPELEDTVRKRARRALRKLAHATNAPRDAESTLEWIATQTELAPRERAGVRYFADRLAREYDEGDGRARERLRRKLPKLIATLTKQLQTYRIKYDIEQPAAAPAMARVTRDTLVAQAERFERAIERIESPDDSEHVHRVRIAAKRLRYVLETIDEPAAANLAKQLTELQDRLGISHDMHAIVNRIVRELGEVGARDARDAALNALNPDDKRERARLAAVRPGLTALAIRARSADRDAFDAFRADWTAERVAATITEIATLGDELIAHTQQKTRRAT